MNDISNVRVHLKTSSENVNIGATRRFRIMNHSVSISLIAAEAAILNRVRTGMNSILI